MKNRLLRDLKLRDVTENPVWEFVYDQEGTAEDCGPYDVIVRAVEDLPVDSLENRIVVTEVRFADNSTNLGALTNISVEDVPRTREFAGISLERNGVWFHLARYFDADFEVRGPSALAAFLDRPVSNIFPIRYDVSRFVRGQWDATVGEIHVAPPKPLSMEERFDLIFGRR